MVTIHFMIWLHYSETVLCKKNINQKLSHSFFLLKIGIFAVWIPMHLMSGKKGHSKNKNKNKNRNKQCKTS